MTDVFLASACRTGIGRFQGSLSGFRAPELGAFAISEALSRAGLDGLAV
ncbi:MAG: acetyl-CoA C-acetyltransferase, partial [Planctomycetota bacterium]|nr:acetyl-CoA C-acetyltransferase [Planctomycetota bacterium]